MQRGRELKELLLIFASLLLCFFASLFFSGCAHNPATRKKELRLVSTKSEIAIGQQVKKEMVERIGEYEDAKLRDYVTSVGNKLVLVSDRKNLAYDFTILDTSQVNAFAAPGGFIFVTRGLLQELKSEDELALVLGHEIGHVVGLHGIKLLERQMGTQILTVLAAIAVGTQTQEGPEAMAAVLESSNLISTLYFLGHSRENELEADHLGLKYTWASRHNPQAALKFFDRLHTIEEREQGKEQASGWDQFFRSHPPTTARISLAQSYLRNVPKGAIPPPNPKDPYPMMISGLPQNQDLEQVVMKGNHFTHRRYGISLEIPAGWNKDAAASRSLIFFWSPDGRAHGDLKVKALKEEDTLEDCIRWIERDLGLKTSGPGAPALIPRQISYSFGPAYQMQFHAGPYFYRVLTAIRQKQAFFLTCVAQEEYYIDYLVAFEGIARSLEFRGS